MKTNIIYRQSNALLLLLSALIFGTCLSARAAEVFFTDFAKGKLEDTGWVVNGGWSVVDFGADRPNLANNPGPVLKFAAQNKTSGSLVKKFSGVANPTSLTLTYDAGYGWGAPEHSQGLAVLLLDDAGNGYLFSSQRAKGDWSVQWAKATHLTFNESRRWIGKGIDTTQKSVVDGGGLKKFTITRDAEGNWTFDCDGWTGGPAKFKDTTYSTFSQVMLVGSQNIDDLLFNNIRLDIIGGTASVPTTAAAQEQEYPDFYNPNRETIDGKNQWVKAIVINTPKLRSEVKGDVPFEFTAEGMTHVNVMCWQQGDAAHPFGRDAHVTPEIALDADGKGEFVFHADQFPNGPLTVRIMAEDRYSRKKDIREIQLFNKGGTSWLQGIPQNEPAGAKGLKPVFADDFDKELSISSDGKETIYCAHKPGTRNTDFSGWQFADPESEMNPFSIVGGYLRIHASKRADGKAGSGILAPVQSRFDADEKVQPSKAGDAGILRVPFYVECRFLAQSAPGTSPAFWTITDSREKKGCTELDVIEAYGGFGEKNPNFTGYACTSHFWEQKDADGKQLKGFHTNVDMYALGGKSTWSTTFHTYGVRVDEEDTVYYFDNIEVLRHKTDEVSKTHPAFFMINYAIGGISGWQIDMEREGNATDMWVDYVRAYQGKK